MCSPAPSIEPWLEGPSSRAWRAGQPCKCACTHATQGTAWQRSKRGCARGRSKTQGIALSLGDKLILKQKG